MHVKRLALTAALSLAMGIGCAVMPAMAADKATDIPADVMQSLQKAIAFQTVDGKHQVKAFAEYLAGQLKAAGFSDKDIDIFPVGNTAAMVVRYDGSGDGKPILISGHMDVVAATQTDRWHTSPFDLTEKDGILYGRGIADMKTNVVLLVKTFADLKQSGFVPKRDLILVFSGDEETAMASTKELAKRYHDAEFLINADAGGGVYDDNLKPTMFRVQHAEKSYVDYRLKVTSKGGHSSEPDVADNAIYHLANALQAVAAYQFPVKSSKITRASFKAIGKHSEGKIADALLAFAEDPTDAKAIATISADPAFVGQIRSTCIATMIDGGDAPNALPKEATANINCRLWPGTSVDAVRKKLAKVIDDPRVTVEFAGTTTTQSPASKPNAIVMDAITKAIHQRYPDVDVVPSMSSGATDSTWFRQKGVASYGASPEFSKPGEAHAHGVNEQLRASEVPAALAYWHTLLTELGKQ